MFASILQYETNNPSGRMNIFNPSPFDSDRGLYDKFRVQRVDGADAPGGKHEGCEYFVLDVTHDPHAQAALMAYAQSCKLTHPKLSADLMARIDGPKIEVERDALLKIGPVIDRVSAGPVAVFDVMVNEKIASVVMVEGNELKLKSGDLLYAAPVSAAPAAPKNIETIRLGGRCEKHPLNIKPCAECARLAVLKEQGLCPDCDGKGEQGGQFCGGYWKCESCGGTGKFNVEESQGQ